MSLYGNYINEVLANESSAPEVEKTITLETYASLMEDTIDFLYESDGEFIAESELLLVEGKLDNKKITDKFVELVKEARKEGKEFRKLFKAAKKSGTKEDVGKAKKSLQNLIKIIEKYRDEIKDIDAGSMSNIITGFLINELFIILKVAPSVILTIISDKQNTITYDLSAIGRDEKFTITKNFALAEENQRTRALSAVIAVLQNIFDIKEAYEKYRATGKEDTRELNIYRTKILRLIDTYLASLRKSEAIIDSYVK